MQKRKHIRASGAIRVAQIKPSAAVRITLLHKLPHIVYHTHAMKKTESGLKRFLKTLLAKTLAALVSAALLAGAGFYAWNHYRKQKYSALSALVSNELLYCAELTTVKAVYSDIVSLKRTEVLGLAKSYSIVRYTGVVRAGIDDISSAVFTISEDRRTVKVTLPPITLLSNDISSMEVFDEHKNIFAPISSREIFEEIDTAKNKVEQTFIAKGLIEDAQVQAVLTIRRILSAMGFKHIEVSIASGLPN